MPGVGGMLIFQIDRRITTITQKQNLCELIALSSGGEQEHLAGCKSPSILLLSAVKKHFERTF